MDWRYLFLDSKGRIGQKDFWIGFLILFVAGLVLGLIPVLGAIIGLILLYPQVCLFSKRLHDFGKTGWLYLAPIVLSVVLAGAMVAMSGAAFFTPGGPGSMSPSAAAGLGGGILLMALLLLVVNLGFLLWVGLSKGDAGPNRYGPPQGSAVAGVF